MSPAQTAPANAAPGAETDNETIVLSPFVVDSSEDKGSYQATSTLAGNRVRTDLRDIASAISVVTSDFLRDTGATNNQTLLQFTANTEVGGLYGNYAGVGGTFIAGANEGSNFLKPANNNRVRGLDSADGTRDLFLTDIPWDSYNTGRIDIQRGPNSILFGIGSPAGIINASLNGAVLNKTSGQFETRFGGYGSIRNSFDYNQVLIKDQLSVRVALLDDDTKYRQKPAFNRDQRLFGALRWSPKLFSSDSIHTSIRANYEHGDVKANRPRVLPPGDRITPYFDSTAINKKTWDPYYAWDAGVVGYPSDPTTAAEAKNFWVVQYMAGGINGTSNPQFIYDSAGSTSQAYVRAANPGTYFGLAASGQPDHSIDGFPYGSNIGIGGYGDMAYNDWRTNGQDGTVYKAADKGFYKEKTMSDPTIFNFYDNLIDGPNKREWQKWDAYNVALEQSFFSNRLAFEFAYDRQKYQDGQTRNLGGLTYISVDIRKNLMVYPGAYSDLAMANPYAGHAYVGSSAGAGNNSGTLSDRENIRLTAFGELRADDFLSRGFLTSLLGKHRFTGLYSKEYYQVQSRNWVRYAATKDWSDAVGNGGASSAEGAQNGGLSNGDVVIDNITYLTGDLSGNSSASGLNIGRIMALQSPSGNYTIPYFDSHWNATGVDPSTPWLNPARSTYKGGEMTTESENVRNYVGWVDGNFRILNADKGDISSLYTDVSSKRTVTESKGITWQGFLWDDTIVGTFGWRRDQLHNRSGSSKSDKWTPAEIDPSISPPSDSLAEHNSGENKSWGIVLHTPKMLRNKLPLGTDITFGFSNGSNNRVETRYDFSGNPLPNARGKTKDFSVGISTLNDRLSFKATWYKTDDRNANLSSVTTEVSTLGNNTYYLRNLEAWGTTSAMLDLAGRAGGASGWEWYWNWALIDNGWDSKYNDPTGTAFQNAASTANQTAAINSWLNQMLPQSWYDAYGFPINVAKAKAGDWQNAITGWNPYSGVGGVQPSGGGRVNGTWPTGTADLQSKGVEFEVVGEPIKGLRISVNASKTKAAQVALGSELSTFIEAAYAKYQSPAGDLRLWWGGDATVRQYFVNNIWSAYQFQVQTNGRMVPEMSPWAANAVANYTFQSHGWLKGVNVGASYRWQDGHIVGYGLNADQDNLDVNKPYWSKSESYVDLWIGYERKLTSKINWRIQTNLRNVGDHPHLIPISVQPDGSPAMSRIAEGFGWQVTNTFSF